MRTLLDVLIVLSAIAAAAWMWLTVGRGLYWRTDQRMPPATAPDTWPDVAVVIPARDEAAVLPDSLPTVLAQEYPGRVRVILVDDGSTDGTGDLARELGAEVLAAAEPDAGWTGKLWALRSGIAAAGEPAYLLLTDADIAHRPDSLAALVAAAEGNGLDLVSQMARLRTESPAERLIVPAFVYFFALLYPFRWVNRLGTRTAAAAGGCSLVRRSALERAGGVAAIRGAVIDDVALARAVKRAGGRIWLGLADRVASVRPYPDLGALWRMVARSAYAQLRRSPLLLAGTVLGLAVLFGVPVAATAGLFAGRWLAGGIGAATWLLMAATYLPMLRYHGRAAPAALLLPATAAVYAAMTVDSAIRHYRGRGAAWKGRTYGAR